MANDYTTNYSTSGDYAAPTRVNYTPESLKLERVSYRKARERAAAMGLRPQDFGGNDWNYQSLSDALGVNITNGKGGRLERILANPTTATHVENDIRKLVGNQFNATQSQYGQLSTPNPNYDADLGRLTEKAKRYGLTDDAVQKIVQDETSLQTRWDADARKKPNEGPGGFTGFMDKVTRAVIPAATAYIGGGILSNAAGFGNAAALAPGSTPAVTAAPTIPGTDITWTQAANVGRTAANIARSDDPGKALTNAAFNAGAGGRALTPNLGDLEVVQNIGKKIGINPGLINRAQFIRKG